MVQLVTGFVVFLVDVVILVLITLGLVLHVVTQHEMGVPFLFGRGIGTKKPGLAIIIPIGDQLTKVKRAVAKQAEGEYLAAAVNGIAGRSRLAATKPAA